MSSQKTNAHAPAHPTAETAAAAQATETASRTVLLLAPLMLGALAYGVLGSVVVPALPLFEHTLSTSETGATWILTSYFLAAAGATAVLGRLGDLFGKRRTLLITLAVLSVGTLISALSNSLAPELIGRASGSSRRSLPPVRVVGRRRRTPAVPTARRCGRPGCTCFHWPSDTWRCSTLTPAT